MANQEARALLAELMGNDRNAPLPKGAARPSKNKRLEDFVVQKRLKSCYDADIDPLYTAWGVDIYDLFINTKFDLGTNPYIVDDTARSEYLKLPTAEKSRLGFDYFLYQKLAELVKSADRTVHRNQEKLHQELQRKRATGGTRNLDLFVEEIDDGAVEQLCRNLIQVENMEQDLADKLMQLDEIVEKESLNKIELESLLEKKAAAAAATATAASADVGASKTEAPSSSQDIEVEMSVTIPTGDDMKSNCDTSGKAVVESVSDEEEARISKLQVELGPLTLDKQSFLFQIANIVMTLPPLQESIVVQRRQLLTMRNDISTDKTVCEVSGNFLSARDADERIAAHYAGKQYQGWKLVRGKLKEMQQVYGRFGPPAPESGRRGSPESRGGGGGMSMMDSRRDHRGSNGRGPPPPPSSSTGRGRSRYDGDGSYGSGGGYNGGGGSSGYPPGPPDRGGRWERRGPLPPSNSYGRSNDRGGGWRR